MRFFTRSVRPVPSFPILDSSHLGRCIAHVVISRIAAEWF